MYICKDGDCGYKGKEKQCCKECQHEKTGLEELGVVLA
jgi:hypothetical protein